jgi:hypothetical protein
MDDENEEPMTLRDEIEDPIYEMKLPRPKKRKILTVGENLFRMLLGLCQDAEEGRFPLLHNRRLIAKTKEADIGKLLLLTREWIQALEEERLHQNVRAIYWTKFLEAFPNLLEQDIPAEAENWALQLRKWGS